MGHWSGTAEHRRLGLVGASLRPSNTGSRWQGTCLSDTALRGAAVGNRCILGGGEVCIFDYLIKGCSDVFLFLR
jgi:hypothetical protein